MVLSLVLAGCYTPNPTPWKDTGDTGTEVTDTDSGADTDTGEDTDTGDDTDTGEDTDTGVDTDTAGDTDTAPIDTEPVVTEHCGNITVDETWGPGEHLVTCDIEVDSATLTLEAGAIVTVQEGTGFVVGGNTGAGALVSAGTLDLPVELLGEIPGAGTWDGLRAEGGGTLSLTKTSVDGAGSTTGAIYSEGGDVFVDGVTLTGAAASGVQLTGSAAFAAGSTNLTVTAPGSYAVIVGAAGAGTVPTGTYDGVGIEVTGGTLATASTWNDLGVPWVVTKDVKLEGSAVDPAVLTIGAGATLAFASGVGLELSAGGGASGLVTLGTETDRVTLTAQDAELAGFWSGIVASLGVETISLSSTDLRWGGTDAALAVEGPEVSVTDVTISGSAGAGFALSGGARFAEGSSGLVVSGNAFPGTAEAMAIGSFGTLAPSLVGNNADYLHVTVGDGITASVTWPLLDVPYWVEDTLTVEGTSVEPAIWTISPGVQIYMASSIGVRVSRSGGAAGLVAEGTEELPIVFSAAESLVAGAWGGIGLYDDAVDADCRFDHVEIAYGGGSSLAGNLHLDAASPTIDHAYLHHSAEYGIYRTNDAAPVIGESVTYSDNTKGDLY